jgi:DNA-binding winged helix-turn-helix (wHTH) protein
MRNQDRLVPRRQLLEEVWGSQDNDRTNHSLNLSLARIRRKLEPDPTQPRYFHTEPGVGFPFRAGRNTQPPPAATTLRSRPHGRRSHPTAGARNGAEHGEQTDPTDRR